MTAGAGSRARRALCLTAAAGALWAAPALSQAPAARAAESCDRRTTDVFDPTTPYPLIQYSASKDIWARGVAGSGVLVAVVDSGVDVRNPHFRVPGTGVTIAANGWSALPPGPFVDAAGKVDETSHGTAVAGIIAARPVDGSGVVGLAPRATILPIQVYAAPQDSGEQFRALWPTSRAMAQGITEATKRGAKIINVSLSQDTDDPELRAAVDFAHAQGSLVVASAGDRATSANKQDVPRYPAAYPNVLSVTAVDKDNQVADSSVHGPHVGVAAPGQLIPTTWKDHGDCLVGPEAATSFSTPLVSATAALVAQQYPAEGPDMWKYRIEASALRPRSDRRDNQLGWGLVSPYDALTMTLDANRPGPTMPGQAPPRVVAKPLSAPAVEPPRDLVGPRRELGGWIAFAAIASAVGMRLVRTLRRAD